MRIQIEPTDIFTEVDGAKVRVWNGITDDGCQCFCFIAGVAVRAEEHPGRAWRTCCSKHQFRDEKSC